MADLTTPIPFFVSSTVLAFSPPLNKELNASDFSALNGELKPSLLKPPMPLAPPNCLTPTPKAPVQLLV